MKLFKSFLVSLVVGSAYITGFYTIGFTLYHLPGWLNISGEVFFLIFCGIVFFIGWWSFWYWRMYE